MKYKDLADTLKYFKEQGEGGYNMCRLMEDYTERKTFAARKEEKYETARKMIAKGMDHAEIAELVGLTMAEVETLAKENK
jgi:hypothetical protein